MAEGLRDAVVSIQGAPIKNNPLGKNYYLIYWKTIFHEIYSFLLRKIQATYAANFVTILAVV